MRYYHTKTIARRSKNRVFMLQDLNGEWVKEKEVEDMITSYFK